MENLIFKYRVWSWAMRIIGVLWVVIGIDRSFSHEPLTLSDWIKAAAFILLGVMFFTPLVGNNETRFVAGNDNLKIKWRTKIREIIIMNNEIEKIILRNEKIEIRRKEKKAVVLPFGEWLWKVEDKKKVYEFMVEYARQKDLVLEK